jgi:hypothetical protein
MKLHILICSYLEIVRVVPGRFGRWSWWFFVHWSPFIEWIVMFFIGWIGFVYCTGHLVWVRPQIRRLKCSRTFEWWLLRQLLFIRLWVGIDDVSSHNKGNHMSFQDNWAYLVPPLQLLPNSRTSAHMSGLNVLQSGDISNFFSSCTILTFFTSQWYYQLLQVFSANQQTGGDPPSSQTNVEKPQETGD